MNKWSIKTHSLPSIKFVGYHNEWPYFAQRFGFHFVDFLEPEPGMKSTRYRLEMLIQKMQQDSIRLIVTTTANPSNELSNLAHRVNGKIVILASSVWANHGIQSYFDLFDYTIDQLVTATR